MSKRESAISKLMSLELVRRGRRPPSEKRTRTHNPNLSSSQRPIPQHVSQLGALGNGSRLLAGYGSLVEGLVKVGIELLARRIELDDSVLLERLEELGLGHGDSVEQGLELRVGGRDGVGDVLEGEGEDVDGGEEIACESLDGKLVRFGEFQSGSTLEVLEVGGGVLEGGLQGERRRRGKEKGVSSERAWTVKRSKRKEKSIEEDDTRML